MTTLTDTQVITASGGLVELGYLSYSAGNVVVTAGTNSYIGGTLTCVCDGSPILVETYVPRVDMVATADQWIQVEMDGVSQGRVVAGYNPGTQQTAGPTHGSLRVTPSAGSHTFRMRAYSNNATTTYLSGGGVFPDAFLRVSKIVQATQWPAVTTGAIICTSSTRPSAPFEGQTIYETDTKRSWTRVGTQWVPDDMVFTNEAARDAAITSPTEGMRAYLTAPTVPAATGDTTAVPTGITTIYNGSAWVCVTPLSAYTTASGQTTAFSSWTPTLTGTPGANPSLTLSTGTTALISTSCLLNTSALGSPVAVSIAVSGATTLTPSNDWRIYTAYGNAQTYAATFVITGLTAGSNTFTLNYRVIGVTGATLTVQDRRITAQGIA